MTRWKQVSFTNVFYIVLLTKRNKSYNMFGEQKITTPTQEGSNQFNKTYTLHSIPKNYIPFMTAYIPFIRQSLFLTTFSLFLRPYIQFLQPYITFFATIHSISHPYIPFLIPTFHFYPYLHSHLHKTSSTPSSLTTFSFVYHAYWLLQEVIEDFTYM